MLSKVYEPKNEDRLDGNAKTVFCIKCQVTSPEHIVFAVLKILSLKIDEIHAPKITKIANDCTVLFH